MAPAPRVRAKVLGGHWPSAYRSLDINFRIVAVLSPRAADDDSMRCHTLLSTCRCSPLQAERRALKLNGPLRPCSNRLIVSWIQVMLSKRKSYLGDLNRETKWRLPGDPSAALSHSYDQKRQWRWGVMSVSLGLLMLNRHLYVHI